jgi:adenylate cyclase
MIFSCPEAMIQYYSKKQNLAGFLLTLLTLVVVVVLYYRQTPVLEGFEAKTYDLRFELGRGPVSPSADIAIIAINDKSIAELGRFPWSRSTFTALVDEVHKAGAKALLMDVFFPEPEGPKVDKAFAAALARAGNVSLAIAFEFAPDGRVIGVTGNIPILKQASYAEGHINFLPDKDGVNRRTMLLVPHEGSLVPSLGLQGAMAALGVKEVVQRPYSVRVGERRVPTDYYDTMLINFLGPPGAFPMYSFADVMKGRIAPEELHDKILFLGMTALGIYDMRVTPFHGNTPGVEINATICDNILRGHFVRRSIPEALLDLLFIILVGALVFFSTFRLRPVHALLLLPLVLGGYVVLAVVMFGKGHWLSIIYPLTSGILAYTVAAGFRFVILDRRSREIHSVFSSYVSKKIVDELVRHPERATIGGDHRQITILFLDIKGFTSISERLPAMELVSTLNRYFDVLTKVIMEHDGTVDKFLGDGLMAYWGAPLAVAHHEAKGAACILALKEAVARLLESHPELPEFTFRAGLNNGDVVAGNIGAPGRKMEYTVIGDTVNLAARLEGTAKFYGVDNLVSESLYAATSNDFIYRELDRIRVVGKKIPITIYELLASGKEGVDDNIHKMLSLFAQGLQAYRDKRWQDASGIFEALCQRYPDDKPSQLYLERCRRYIKEPPPENWDTIFQRKEK